MKEILRILPETIRGYLETYSKDERSDIEEIRLRIERPVEVVLSKTIKQNKKRTPPIFSDKEASFMMALLSQHSLYRLEEELRRGYITIPGGHRVGIAGRVVMENGVVKGLREIGSFNIRIAKEKKGVCDPYISNMIHKGKWTNTLIVGAPKTGKTTLLRDLARQISLGIPLKNIPAKNVAIIDERSEIAGCIRGIPQHHFGMKLDVLDACPKAEGMMMMIRSMSPDVLIVDEIGREDDAKALMEAVYAGVSVISTVHGTSIHEVKRRPTMNRLLEQCAFETIIELSQVGKLGVCRKMNTQSSTGRLVIQS